MELKKLNDIYVELRGDSWFDSEKPLDAELDTAMLHVMPQWLYDQAKDLIAQLYALDQGNTEDEECFVMIDMDLFRSGMYEAHQEIIKNRNAETLAALDVLDGDDEEYFDIDKYVSDAE